MIFDRCESLLVAGGGLGGVDVPRCPPGGFRAVDVEIFASRLGGGLDAVDGEIRASAR